MLLVTAADSGQKSLFGCVALNVTFRLLYYTYESYGTSALYHNQAERGLVSASVGDFMKGQGARGSREWYSVDSTFPLGYI